MLRNPHFYLVPSLRLLNVMQIREIPHVGAVDLLAIVVRWRRTALTCLKSGRRMDAVCDFIIAMGLIKSSWC